MYVDLNGVHLFILKCSFRILGDGLFDFLDFSDRGLVVNGAVIS